MTKTKALIHAQADYVAVATDDIKSDEDFVAVYMDAEGKQINVHSKDPVNLGHKIALRNIHKGEKVIEYGEVIGAATQEISAGQHIHTHNLKSLRW
jgi:(2R)-sulfolactate sulfo-lyase subunit alpha